MLNILSKNVQTIIIKVILGLISLVFVFWGFGGYNTRSSVLVATVNGTEITRTEVEKVYNRMLTNFKNQMRQLQGDVSNELINSLNLKKRALDEIIKSILLKEEAKKLNFTATNQEVKDAIKDYPEFQENGRFSIDKYRYILQQSGVLPAEFEENRRELILLGKVENVIIDSVQVSEAEALFEFKKNNEKVSINFISFNPSDFKDQVTMTDAELQKYFDENSLEFNLPEKVKVEILAFENDVYSQKVQVSEQEIQAYYDNNKSEFLQEEKVKVSHILISSKIGEDPQIRDEAKKEAEDILVKLKNGENFDELARKYSHDVRTASNNGYIGWIKKGEKDKAFEDAAFALKAGEYSDVVETKDGFHIISVMDTKEEIQKELFVVKDDIVKKLSIAKGKDMIAKLTRDARREVFVSKDLKSYAQKNSITLLTPEPFALNEEVNGIGRNSNFNRQAFDVKEGDVSDIIELPRGSFIVKVISKIPSKTPAFAEVKEAVAEKLRVVKSTELAESKAEEALSMVQSGKELIDVATAFKLQIDLSEKFPRKGYSAPKIGVSEELVNASFGLSAEKPFPSKIFNVNNKLYLIRFAGMDAMSMENFNKERAMVIKQLKMQKANNVLASYHENLMEAADIKIVKEP